MSENKERKGQERGCSEEGRKNNSLQLNFRVFNFGGFLRPRIINNRENFQNYGTCKLINFRVFNIGGFLRPRIINNRENFQNYGTCKLISNCSFAFTSMFVYKYLKVIKTIFCLIKDILITIYEPT